MTMEDRAKFGIPLLDDALGGGVPRGSIILVEDEVGINTEHVLIQFLSEGLRTGEYGYILSTEHLFAHYSPLFVPYSISEVTFETKRLVFLDAFSNPFGYSEGRPSAGGENIIRDITQPRHVTDQIRRSLLHVRSQPIRGVLDSLTTILLVSDTLKPPMAFLQHKIATDKDMGIVSILTLHRDVHEEHIVKAVEHYCDGVIRMTHTALEDKEQTEMLQIRKVPGMSLSELENTDFIFRPSPGHIELTPLM
ncbi:MAG: RAD55 family ATPase [Candidatus Hodarchaeales archaeon]|jgi:KaiC/GvpD/RAD55 family RecA-like ATPase